MTRPKDPIEAPTVQRGASVNPANVVSGYQQVTQNNAKESYLEGDLAKAGKYDQIAQIGSQIAQNSANQFAEQKGIEAAQNPGRQLLPAFTESDSHFVSAYKKEEAQVLNFQGNKYLNNLYQNFANNPNISQKELQTFQQSAAQGIEKVVQQSNPSNRAALQRSLEETYMGQAADLTKRSVHNSLKKDKERREAQGALTSYQMQNSVVSTGPSDESKKFFEQRMAQIDETSAVERWAPEKTKVEKMLEREKFETGIGMYNFLQKEEERPGSGHEVVNDLVKNPPKGLDKIQQMNVAEGVARFANKYDATLSSQRHINFLTLNNKVDDNTLTSQELADADLSGAERAQINGRLIKKNKKENDANILYTKMKPMFGNIAAMAQFSDAEVDSSYQMDVKTLEQDISNKTGEDYKLNLVDKAFIAKGIKHNLTSLTDEIEQTAKYGDSDQAVDAVRAMRVLSDVNTGNPIAVQKLDKESRSILTTYDALRTDTKRDPNEALKLARGDVNVDPSVKTSRLEQWKDYQQVHDEYKTSNSRLTYIAKNLGLTSGLIFKTGDKTLVPEGMEVDYMALMGAYIPISKDPKLAEKNVFDEMRSIYNETNYNNRREIMKDDPLKEFPEEEVGFFAKNDRVRALKDIVANSKGFTINKLEWIGEPPDTTDLITKDIVPGDLKILINGTACKVVVKEDRFTQFSNDTNKSWEFAYIDPVSGQELPIVDMSAGSVARWKPDMKYLENYYQSINKSRPKAMQEYKDKQLEIAKQTRKDLADIVKAQILIGDDSY